MGRIKYLLSLILVLSLFSFRIQKEFITYINSSITWVNSEHNFGKIKHNIPVKAEFEFKNPSMIPLIISSVEPQCGCTVADYPKQPLKSGKTGKIIVTYDAKNLGYFQKSIIVRSNTDEATTTLIIKGEVVEKIENSETK